MAKKKAVEDVEVKVSSKTKSKPKQAKNGIEIPKQKKKWYKGLFSKCIVLAIIIMNVIFTYEVFRVFEITGAEPTALCGFWFSWTTGELWFLAGLSKEKIRNNTEG